MFIIRSKFSLLGIHFVKSMASNKAPGIDKIPVRVNKDCLPSIAPLLTSIINNTFRSLTFPLAWKTAEVTPLLKEGDCEKAENNRPISLLPVFSKVYANEWLMNNLHLTCPQIVVYHVNKVEIENIIQLKRQSSKQQMKFSMLLTRND